MCDLVREQAAQGHEVGIVCDSGFVSDGSERKLTELSTMCSLGIHRVTMSRLPSPSDLRNTALISKIAKTANCAIIHGHGAKGGLYARLVARIAKSRSVYTPHGGSLHYKWTQPIGLVSLLTEKLLSKLGDGYVFVCEFERREFEKKIGSAGKNSIVVQNGLNDDEFANIELAPAPTDLLFVGEMRTLKGVDLLLLALTRLPDTTLTLVGDGPELQQFEHQVQALGLGSRARFAGRMPMREALTLGRMLVVPSRNESFPYVILEAVAAGVPTLASDVGGISEILPPQFLFEAVEPRSIADLVSHRLNEFKECRDITQQLRSKLRHNNSVREMTTKINKFYSLLGILSKL